MQQSEKIIVIARIFVDLALGGPKNPYVELNSFKDNLFECYVDLYKQMNPMCNISRK